MQRNGISQFGPVPIRLSLIICDDGQGAEETSGHESERPLRAGVGIPGTIRPDAAVWRQSSYSSLALTAPRFMRPCQSLERTAVEHPDSCRSCAMPRPGSVCQEPTPSTRIPTAEQDFRDPPEASFSFHPCRASRPNCGYMKDDLAILRPCEVGFSRWLIEECPGRMGLQFAFIPFVAVAVI